eukprot:SAG22_NODE_512_length_9579_cov_27.293143_7_plen_182_part_00
MTVGRSGPAGSMYAFWSSPDGVNFSMISNSSTLVGDRSTFYFDPFRRKWIYSIKNNGSPWGRHRLYSETDNLFTGVHWNQSDAVLWAHADRLDPPFLSGDADGAALPPRGRGPTCPDSSSSSFNASYCAAELCVRRRIDSADPCLSVFTIDCKHYNNSVLCLRPPCKHLAGIIWMRRRSKA